jgi:hypothetical protein
VSHRDIDRLDFYGSSDDAKVEAQTLVKAEMQPGIDMVTIATLLAAAARVRKQPRHFHFRLNSLVNYASLLLIRVLANHCLCIVYLMPEIKSIGILVRVAFLNYM